MLRCTAAASETTSCPATRAEPLSGIDRVVRMRIAVVLPAPLGPRTPQDRPGGNLEVQAAQRLYYHFERKEDILFALHMRLHELGRGMFDRIGELSTSQEAAEVWPELLDLFIDQLLSNREIFILHERNHTALAALEDSERHRAEHDDIEGQLRSFLASPAIPLAQRVRMACSIGAVMSILIGAGEAFGDVPAATLAQLVRDAMRDLLGGPQSAPG
jgi:AcrR family transcriptional regulator